MSNDLPVQTQSDDDVFLNFLTIKEAMDYVKENKDILNISFAVRDERVRLTRNENGNWICDPIYFG